MSAKNLGLGLTLVLAGCSSGFQEAALPNGAMTLAEREVRFRAYEPLLSGRGGKEPSAASDEVDRMLPIFEKGRRASLPFSPDPHGPEARAWRWRGREYVVILNRKKGVLQKLPNELLSPEWRPLFEVRRDPRDLLEKVGEAYYLRPYQVLVLESGFRWLSPVAKSWGS